MAGFMMKVIRKCAKTFPSNSRLANLIPKPIQQLVRKRFYTVEYELHKAVLDIPVKGMPSESDYESVHPWTIGIIRDPFFNHTSYQAACRDHKVAYKTIDLFASDWTKQINDCECDAFVVWPGESIVEWKRLYDERLRFLTVDMEKVLYPSYDSLWLYGSKQRQRDWMDIHGFPHPRTWVFYDENSATSFLESAKLPLIAKLDIGASSNGVWVIKTINEVQTLLKRVFSKGIAGKRSDARARQWRHILFQEFVPGFREWRILRIGDSYFGHEKGKAGDFNSGSGVVGWCDPPREALELIHSVTEEGRFRSMAMDVFETSDGTLLINELQSIFGSFDEAQMYIDGTPGRYNKDGDRFVFEEGKFCQNASCNLRVEDLLRGLSHR